MVRVTYHQLFASSLDAHACLEPIYRLAEKEWKDFIDEFTPLLVEVDPQIPHLPPKDVTHRIYRDVSLDVPSSNALLMCSRYVYRLGLAMIRLHTRQDYLQVSLGAGGRASLRAVSAPPYLMVKQFSNLLIHYNRSCVSINIQTSTFERLLIALGYRDSASTCDI